MPGPKNEQEARVWIREAVANRRYTPSFHFAERLVERDFSMNHVLHALSNPVLVEPYPAIAEHDGTCWRVIGRLLDDGRRVAVGVEACLDAGARQVILCTALDLPARSR